MFNKLAETCKKHTQILQSSVFFAHFRGKQDSILFSLYYLGLKSGQCINKDGILFYLEN
jgi:hypothetical protein